MLPSPDTPEKFSEMSLDEPFLHTSMSEPDNPPCSSWRELPPPNPSSTAKLGIADSVKVNRSKTQKRSKVVISTRNKIDRPNIWYRSNAKYSVVFELPIDDPTFEDEFLRVARILYPRGIGLGISQPAEDIIEIHMFDERDCEYACADGVSVRGHRIYPYRTISPLAVVVRANLSGLPPLEYTEMVSFLRACFADYGTLHDMVLYEEREWFMGEGYVDLLQSPDRSWKPMNRHIIFKSTTILASWQKQVRGE
ncbi:hypothetical protein J3Q64DRAFT_1774214 [Phycomyces blakesleeanus]|uniref:Uncharacterized protein n=1 Tax=Phycomyces blakesleeanus TaxID=4837 RepID=A0ABR3AJF4_PHYBL